MNRRDFIKTTAVAGAASSCSGWVRAQSADTPNIVFILSDQWRKQALGFMNEDRVLTPHLDALAARSAVFTNAISTVPVCGPNRACLFSGKYSMNTGVLGNGCRLMPEHQTFGEISKAAGYQTAYIGKWHLGCDIKPDTGYVAPEYRHGFDFWYKSEHHQPFRQPWFVGNDKESSFPGGDWEPDHLEEVASDFVTRRDKNKPFAMTLSFATPHTGGGPGMEGRSIPGRANLPENYGYAAPGKYEALYVEGGSQYHRPVRENVEPIPDYEESKCVQGYFGAITAIDEAMGRFFQTLEKEGVLENTILVVSADHGEMMGSHKRMTKGIWYQESIGIPMIVHYPAAVKPAQYSCVFNSIDLLPTLLGLSGLPNPGNLDGTSFAPLLRGNAQKTPELAFGAYYRGSAAGYNSGKGWRQFRSVYAERYTYLLTSDCFTNLAAARELLYDLQADPFEMHPIKRGEGQDDLMDQFMSALTRHLDETNDPFLAEVWPKPDADVDWTPYSSQVKQTWF
jgi:arylsulfatase A-like enzyme